MKVMFITTKSPFYPSLCMLMDFMAGLWLGRLWPQWLELEYELKYEDVFYYEYDETDV